MGGERLMSILDDCFRNCVCLNILQDDGVSVKPGETMIKWAKIPERRNR
jgi:hypothetical protein